MQCARPAKKSTQNTHRMLEEDGKGARGAFVNGKGAQVQEEDNRAVRGVFPNAKQVQDEYTRSGRGYER